MFSLFNGEYGGKKNINLGGNRSAGSRQDRDALLKATQLERQQRDMERRRMNAAVQIQVGFTTICVILSVWFDLFSSISLLELV